jgi:hypothetical protein
MTVRHPLLGLCRWAHRRPPRAAPPGPSPSFTDGTSTDGSMTALPEHSSTVSSDEGGAVIAAGRSALRRIAT